MAGELTQDMKDFTRALVDNRPCPTGRRTDVLPRQSPNAPLDTIQDV
eukprot:CAMPEP_0117658450 /NCGR_PEP_ID=MMETSP0804-20121206/5870_1 /TAXON_ID=1074897 /ORGANISM="Tetraselmis astigmatica, Strain CCMP880" /LENGTH=46 /DNA_ID= /DNA_START= /DNA_END= /DNA_ORIENTATION=